MILNYFYVSNLIQIVVCTRLQKSFYSLGLWYNVVGFDLAIQKCKVMSFNRTSSELKYVYYVGNYCLERVNNVEDSEFIYTPTLSFEVHIDYIVGKVLQVLGFVRWHSRSVVFGKGLLALYYSLVRLIVDYESVMWSSDTARDKLKDFVLELNNSYIFENGNMIVSDQDKNDV